MSVLAFEKARIGAVEPWIERRRALQELFARPNLTPRDTILIDRIIALVIQLEQIEQAWSSTAALLWSDKDKVRNYHLTLSTLTDCIQLLDNPGLRLDFPFLQKDTKDAHKR